MSSVKTPERVNQEDLYAIQTISLTKQYGERTVVNGLDLAIKKGEMFSLLGPNGAGKSTTIKMLCCLLRWTAKDVSQRDCDEGWHRDSSQTAEL